MPPEEATPTETSKSFDAELRKDLRKLLAMFLPTFLIGFIAASLNKSILQQPDQAAVILLVAIPIWALLLMRASTRKKLRVGWPFLVFFSIYILTFWLAAESNVLDWKSKLVGSEDDVPHNSLAVNSYGDWHYSFVRPWKAEDKLVLVMMKPPAKLPDGRSDAQGRKDIADLLALAVDNEARGVAIDSYFSESPKNDKTPREKGIDEMLCKRLNDARAKGLHVFAVYDFELIGDRPDMIRTDPDLKPCLPESDLAHMMGFAGHDGRVRSIPLYFRHDHRLEVLSLRVARALGSGFTLPRNEMLQFTEPKGPFPMVTFEELNQPDAKEARHILKGRFVLAGEDSDQDSFETPFGNKPGVMIHAYAIQSLLQNRFIKRPPVGLSLFPIGVWCYLLMVFTALGWKNLTLVLINIAASIFTIASSALAMYLCLRWIDVIYPLLAAWLFLFLLIALRRIGLNKTRAMPS